MDNRTLELVISQPYNRWAWYELAKHRVPQFCAICLCDYLKADKQALYYGYTEYRGMKR